MRRVAGLSVACSGAFGAAIVAAVVACGSTGGAAGVGLADGSPGVDGSSASSSSGDGASSGSDGASSSGSPDGSGAGPFCPTLTPTPKLCFDFDDGMAPSTSMTEVDTAAGAVAKVDGTVFRSPPDSYETLVPPGVTGVTNAVLKTSITFSASAARFVVSFDFLPNAAPPATGTLVVARAFVGSDHNVALELAGQSGAVLREQEGLPPTLDQPSQPLTKLPVAGVWTRYALSFDLGAKTATLTQDGQTVATIALQGQHYDLFGPNIGLQSDSGFTAHYDDCVLDTP